MSTKIFPIFSGIRDPLNVLIWSKTGPNLAIGSYRGNLMLYNHRTSRKVPVVGKHNKAITCGAWSEANLLALGSEDRTLSISNIEGDTLRVATLRAEPSDVQFSEMKQVQCKNLSFSQSFRNYVKSFLWNFLGWKVSFSWRWQRKYCQSNCWSQNFIFIQPLWPW